MHVEHTRGVGPLQAEMEDRIARLTAEQEEYRDNAAACREVASTCEKFAAYFQYMEERWGTQIAAGNRCIGENGLFFGEADARGVADAVAPPIFNITTVSETELSIDLESSA